MATRPTVFTAVCTAGLVALGTAGCRDTPAAFGTDPLAARANATALLDAVATNHTRVTRTAVLATARHKLVTDALVPSRVYKDPSVWTAIQPDSARVLSSSGHIVGDHYLIAELADPPRPDRLGDQRHLIRLMHVGPHDFEWNTSVEMDIGSLRADDIDRIVSSLLATAATTPCDALRAGSEVAFPHATEALGRLFSLDTVRTVPAGDGSTSVTLVFGLHPDRLKPVYPDFAAYIARYTGPTRLRYVLSDPGGGGSEWFDLELAEGRIAVRFRSTGDGHLAPSTGAVRPMPDTLLLRTDFHTKLWLLALGMVDLESQFSLVRTEHARGWHMSFRHEPRWHLPLGMNIFVLGPLKEPFEGDGAQFDIAIRDTTGAPTLLVRSGRLVVRESLVMQWFGGLGTRVYADFSGRTETQQYSFIADAMTALVADLGGDTVGVSTGAVSAESAATTRP
jgi:hypothetical protein